MLQFINDLDTNGTGILIIEDIEGTIDVDLFENLKLDRLAANLNPFIDVDEGEDILTVGIFTYQINPFINIKSVPPYLQSIKSPELRRKFGNYGYSSGCEVSVDSEGNISSIPYYRFRDFLIYEKQELEPCRHYVSQGFQGAIDYSINPSFSAPTRNADIRYPSFQNFNGSGDLSAYLLSLNLSPGVIADLILSYAFVYSRVNEGESDFLVYPR